jgi:ComF family protein
MKYSFTLDISQELADYMEDKLTKSKLKIPNDSLFIAVPLHRRRKNLRGFNQSEEVGKLLATKMGWDFKEELLIRKKMTTPQTELKGEKRKENVKGAFSIKKENNSLLSKYKSLIIFDDVYTTGSTLKEAARVLKENGAKKIWGMTIAR